MRNPSFLSVLGEPLTGERVSVRPQRRFFSRGVASY